MKFFVLLAIILSCVTGSEAQSKIDLNKSLEQALGKVITNIPPDTLNKVLKNTLNNALYDTLNSTVFNQLPDQARKTLHNQLDSLIDTTAFNLLQNNLRRELNIVGIQIPNNILDDVLKNASRGALKSTLKNTLRNDPNNIFTNTLINSLAEIPIDINLPIIDQINVLKDGLEDLANASLDSIDIGKFNETLNLLNDKIKEFALNPIIALNRELFESIMELISSLFSLFGVDFAWPCTDNTETVTSQQEQQTTEIISTKERELETAIKEYAKALKKKKEMMTTLWKTVSKVEFLMKENQVLRKEMMKYWEDVKQSHTSAQSL